MSEPIKDVDTYINQFEGEPKKRLMILREIVRAEVPRATEGIMYGLIGYKLNSKPLVYFGSFPGHTGFYATPQSHEQFSDELSQYKQGKGSVQFPHNQPLPENLVRRMVRFKKQQIEAE